MSSTPSVWVRETPLTKLKLKFWGNCWRNEVICGGGRHVGQVGRTATDAHQVHKHAQFVLYALPDRKPVQASEYGSDVIPCPDSSNKSGGGVLDSLK